MPRHVIRHGRVIGDVWQFLVPSGDESPSTVRLPDGALAVALSVWKARRAELLARGSPLGVVLEGGDDPADIAGDLRLLELVAVRFTRFTDGRGYSIATLLRRRHGYTGELRATGEVLRDQLFYLARCGFDAFQLRDGADPVAALPSLRGFSAVYQHAADDRVPERRGEAAPPPR